MDISVQIIHYPVLYSPHVITDPQKNAARLMPGDPVNVYPHDPTIIPDPNGIFAFIHITDIPDGFVTIEDIQAIVLAFASPGLGVGPFVRLRRWTIPIDNMTPPEQADLDNNKTLETGWAKFKKYCRYKEIIDWLDANNDTKTRELDDTDFA